jgi:hypothetical protein
MFVSGRQIWSFVLHFVTSIIVLEWMFSLPPRSQTGRQFVYPMSWMLLFIPRGLLRPTGTDGIKTWWSTQSSMESNWVTGFHVVSDASVHIFYSFNTELHLPLLTVSNYCSYIFYKPISVATRSKAWVCSRLHFGIAGSNISGTWISFFCEWRVLSRTDLGDEAIPCLG